MALMKTAGRSVLPVARDGVFRCTAYTLLGCVMLRNDQR